jgi:ATP-dependent exoDNAse (exonuclease V) beta subunit
MTVFTEEQKIAVEYRNMDACVVAGPGSGKTTVLVERYRRLIASHDFSPDQILAITFTEKAAANMKARLAKQFEGNEKLLRELDRAWVSTIHAFCARVLKENAISAAIDPRFAVLDAREAEDLQYECLNAALDEFTVRRTGEMLSLIEALQNPRLTDDLLSAWDALRSSGKSLCEVRGMRAPAEPKSGAQLARELRGLAGSWPAKLTPAQTTQRAELLEFAQRLENADHQSLAEWLPVEEHGRFNLGRVPMSERDGLKKFREDLVAIVDAKIAPCRELIFEILGRFEALYGQRKAEKRTLDFDDLERHTTAMLERNPVVRDRLRRQFRQVMLDEFQDINDQQAKLIRLIRSDNVFFGVGDINQSIYGFRHARPEIFRDYHSRILDEGKHAAELLQNFRSHDGILRSVETLLYGADGIEDRALVAKETPEDAAPAVELLRIIDGAEDEPGEREARWIAHRIARLRELQGYKFRNFAVLCRGGDAMKPILAAFDAAGIPYVCGRRESVLSSREGRDLAALLYTIANPRDTVALATVLRSPLVGLSDEGLLRLRLAGGSLSSGLNGLAHNESAAAGFAPDDAEKLRDFTALLRRWRLESTVTPLDLLLSRALADCGFSWTPGTVSGDNIQAFLKLARTRGANRPLLEFLHELDSLEKAIDTESELADEDQGDQVQVMTAHAAKGLEFPVTMIAAMQKGVQRDSRSISFTPEHGLGIRWRSPVEKDGVKDSWQYANGERLKQREKEEGNRLLYVAMTRAEERLILSWSCRDNKNASNWANLTDKFFGLKDRAPAPDPRIETVTAPNGSRWTASVLVTAEEPPYTSARTSAAPAEMEIVDAPPAGERSESSAAVTSLALFAECPRKYYLARHAGWSGGGRRKLDFDGDDDDESFEPAELPASELGTEVHSVLAEKPGEYEEEALRLARVFRESPLGAESAAAVRIEREWEFIVEMEGAFVRGSIDLWFEDAAGRITIVDYKTDEVTAAEARARAHIYRMQVALYAAAVQAALGARPVRACLHFLKPDHVEEVEAGPAAIEAARRLVRELRAAQNDLRFDLNEGGHCRSCPYFRELCPAPTAAGSS